MSEFLHRTVTVGEGGKIEVVAPEFAPGIRVEVDIRTVAPLGAYTKLTDIVGAAKGVYGSREEVDTMVRELRDEWDD